MATTIQLNPEDEMLIQKHLQGGEFANAQEVIHHALRVLEAEEAWLTWQKREVADKIDKAIAEFDEGHGIPASQVSERLQEMKTASLAK